MDDVPDYLGIKCIKFNKVVGCELEYKPLNEVITDFVTNVVFQHISLSLKI